MTTDRRRTGAPCARTEPARLDRVAERTDRDLPRWRRLSPACRRCRRAARLGSHGRRADHPLWRRHQRRRAYQSAGGRRAHTDRRHAPYEPAARLRRGEPARQLRGRRERPRPGGASAGARLYPRSLSPIIRVFDARRLDRHALQWHTVARLWAHRTAVRRRSDGVASRHARSASLPGLGGWPRSARGGAWLRGTDGHHHRGDGASLAAARCRGVSCHLLPVMGTGHLRGADAAAGRAAALDGAAEHPA